MSNFMKIHPAGARLFHADGQTDHGEANSQSRCTILRTRLKKIYMVLLLPNVLCMYLATNSDFNLVQA